MPLLRMGTSASALLGAVLDKKRPAGDVLLAGLFLMLEEG